MGDPRGGGVMSPAEVNDLLARGNAAGLRYAIILVEESTAHHCILDNNGNCLTLVHAYRDDIVTAIESRIAAVSE